MPFVPKRRCLLAGGIIHPMFGICRWRYVCSGKADEKNRREGFHCETLSAIYIIQLVMLLHCDPAAYHPQQAAADIQHKNRSISQKTALLS